MVDSEHQLKMVLDSSVEEVSRDMDNITRALTQLSGFEVHSHSVQPGGGGGGGGRAESSSTDVLLYAVEESNGLLVETDR